jgi:hypothetical protein
MTAKDSLAQTLNAVAALNDELSNMKNEYIYFQQLAKEASEMAREELLSTRCASLNLKISFLNFLIFSYFFFLFFFN